MSIPLASFYDISSQAYNRNVLASSSKDALEALSSFHILLLPHVLSSRTVHLPAFEDSNPQRFLADFQLSLYNLVLEVTDAIHRRDEALINILTIFVTCVLPSASTRDPTQGKICWQPKRS